MRGCTRLARRCPPRLLRQGRAEAKKRAEHRIRSRYIPYIPNVTELVLKITQRGRRYGSREDSQKLEKKTEVYLNTARKHNCINQSSRRLPWKSATKLGQNGNIILLPLNNAVAANIGAKLFNLIKKEDAIRRGPNRIPRRRTCFSGNGRT